MASSSTSSVPRSFVYDVFLSFRGEDTRNNFVAHLHSALKRESIITYKDDENMMRGEHITDELIRAIENSRFYVIVFSKNYASSSWCLDELAKIMECQERREQKAYPVFYHVEPTQVRNQSGAFGEAFEKNKMKEDAGKWRKALYEAAGLAGFGLEDTNGDEAKFIEEVAEKILQELPSIKFSHVEKFIGMEARVEEIILSSNIGSNEVHMIGIKGMGGAGKTTLAKAIYDKFSHHFGNKSFVENVREKVSKDSFGLKSLQEQVLSNMSKGKIIVNGESDGKLLMKKRMCDKEVLLVLDDVDDIKQLEALADPCWFRPGSIIVITTRDEDVLIKHRVNSVHDVSLLSREEAICLFSWHAFRTESPIPVYEELSQQVVRYAAGLPLTIRVLGSDLIGKDELEWEDTVERLKEIPPKETLQQLELSYMGLEADHKTIFLDVACFWKGKRKEEAIIPLQSCQLCAVTGLKVLERKSLITVTRHGTLEMHDSIQEMGWDIVRRDHRDEPERHSRLWIREEIEYMLANDLGNESTRGIRLIGSELSPSIIMKGLKKMKKLRFLYVDGLAYINFNDRKFYEANGYFPNSLQYLYWYCYPFTSLPLATLQECNLSGLCMHNNNLVQLWGKRKVLKKLRFFDFHGSYLTTLDLGSCPNLETLSINCDSLEKLHMPAKCPKLKYASIVVSALTTIDLDGASNLETLSITDCTSLEKLHMPAKCPKLKSFDIFGEWDATLEKLELIQNSKLVKIQMPAECPKLESLKTEHPMLRMLSGLERCDESIAGRMVIECPSLQSLHIWNGKVKTLNLGMILYLESITLHDLELALNLENLNLEACSQLREIRILHCSELITLDLGLSPNLEDLHLVCCSHLVQVCMPIGYPSLRCLTLRYLPELRALDTAMTPNLEELILEECDQLELQMPLKCSKLKTLHLSGLMQKTLELQTSNLEKLCFERCSGLLELHMLDECPKLKTLDLNSSSLETLKLKTPNLEDLCLEECYNLLELHMLDECPKLKTLDLNNSTLETLKLNTPNLEGLNLDKCYNLLELHMLDECPKLKSLSISCSKLRTFNLAQTPNIKELILEGCEHLELPMPLKCSKLEILNLSGSLQKSLGLQTPNLSELIIEKSSNLLELHMLDECPKLKMLSISCSKLRTFNLAQTPNLKHLHLQECYNLAELHAPIACLRKICRLYLSGSLRFKTFDFPNKFEDSDVDGFPELKVIVESVDTSNNNFLKFQFECYNDERPLLTGNLEKLFSNLESFYESICDLQDLRKLELIGDIPDFPDALCWPGHLEELTISSKDIRRLPDSICVLKQLKYLKLESCWLLEKLPQDLGQLECLETLCLSDCIFLGDIPKSICQMKCLKYLHLSYCFSIKELPEELGHLVSLKELWVEGIGGIRYLPLSIFRLLGLRIIGCDWLLRSWGLAPQEKVSENVSKSLIYRNM